MGGRAKQSEASGLLGLCLLPSRESRSLRFASFNCFKVSPAKRPGANQLPLRRHSSVFLIPIPIWITALRASFPFKKVFLQNSALSSMKTNSIVHDMVINNGAMRSLTICILWTSSFIYLYYY